ncbi:hypothetical protein SNEBB_002925 [Seison nebaliae]|nr:hypothetical protein SNEBB_002925 [Seison nebaliae]
MIGRKLISAFIRLNHIQSSSKKSITSLFLDKNVRDRLEKVTHFDLDRILRQSASLSEKREAELKLLTELEYNELVKDAEKRARKKLQMYPVLDNREIVESIDSDNLVIQHENESKINGAIDENHVFVDISNNIPYRQRSIVIRQPNGRLRKASINERQRLLRTYYPKPHQLLNRIPKMFSAQYLEKLLERQEYLFILDKACFTIEPFDENFIQVTNRTYDHINERKSFNLLRNTRYFGTMTFHLVRYEKELNLIKEMIQKDLLTDAIAVIELKEIIHNITIEGDSIKEKLMNYEKLSKKDDIELQSLLSNL